MLGFFEDYVQDAIPERFPAKPYFAGDYNRFLIRFPILGCKDCKKCSVQIDPDLLFNYSRQFSSYAEIHSQISNIRYRFTIHINRSFSFSFCSHNPELPSFFSNPGSGACFFDPVAPCCTINRNRMICTMRAHVRNTFADSAHVVTYRFLVCFAITGQSASAGKFRHGYHHRPW